MSARMQVTEEVFSSQAVHTPDSVLLWEGSQGQISNIWCYVTALVAFGLLFPVGALVGSALPAGYRPYIVLGPLVPLAWLVWRIVATAMHHYQLTGQRFRESSGVLNRQTEELELYRVKDIVVKRPILYRFLGRGTIIMPTSDKSTPTIVLACISDPLHVADLIRERVETCRVGKGVRELD
jgi:uncharacterized membrane protein YdbT with pleckstrin-like domain